MDQRRLLPGGPSNSVGSTVGRRVLSLLPRLDLTNLDPLQALFIIFHRSREATQ